MTRDEIIRMAREVWSAGGLYIGPSESSLERFAALIAAAEREACAQIGDGYDYGDRNCGDEIRARGMK